MHLFIVLYLNGGNRAGDIRGDADNIRLHIGIVGRDHLSAFRIKICGKNQGYRQGDKQSEAEF